LGWGEQALTNMKADSKQTSRRMGIVIPPLQTGIYLG
jgi:hypothetical protein